MTERFIIKDDRTVKDNFINCTNWKKYNSSTGVPSLTSSTIESIDVYITSLKEQCKIAEFLTLIDVRIDTQNKIIEDLFTEFQFEKLVIDAPCDFIHNKCAFEKVENAMALAVSDKAKKIIDNISGAYFGLSLE